MVPVCVYLTRHRVLNLLSYRHQATSLPSSTAFSTSRTERSVPTQEWQDGLRQRHRIPQRQDRQLVGSDSIRGVPVS